MSRLLTFAAIVTALASGCAHAQVRFHGEAAGASVNVMSWREIPFRTVVRQQRDYSCGSAALATLLTYHYDRPTSEPQAFTAMYAKGDQAKIRQVGFSMLDMKRYLEGVGIKSDGFRMTFEDLAQRKAPVIVLIDLGAYRHFVVVKGMEAGKVLVGDPALGLHTFTEAEFRKVWSGVALAVTEVSGPAPVFNKASDWSPWAVAPVGAVPTSSLEALTAGISPFYQITPSRAIDTTP